MTSYNDLGRIAETLGDVDKALEYYLKSMALAEETGYTRGYIGVLNNVGPLYTKKNYSKGLEYLNQVLELRIKAVPLLLRKILRMFISNKTGWTKH